MLNFKVDFQVLLPYSSENELYFMVTVIAEKTPCHCIISQLWGVELFVVNTSQDFKSILTASFP